MLIAFSLFQFPSMMKENHVGVSAGKLGKVSNMIRFPCLEQGHRDPGKLYNPSPPNDKEAFL